MHFVLSALLLCAFFVLLLSGLASVLRDLLSRDYRPLVVAARRARSRSRFAVRSRPPVAAVD
jgi:hypothetical protein